MWKKNEKSCLCVDYTALNKVFLKDFYTPPNIEQMINATIAHQWLSFMNAYLEGV